LVKVGDASTFKLLKIDLVSPLDTGFENYTVSQLSSGGTDPNDNDEFLVIPLGVASDSEWVRSMWWATELITPAS
jgi:hypothetical protein